MADAKHPGDPADHCVRMSGKLLAFQRAEARRDRDILRARRDPAFFVEYVIPHDKTGLPIKNADFHREWHTFFSSTRLGVISAAIEHGKTLQIGVGRILWEIGNDPELRCMVIGASEDAAIRKVLRPIKKHIRTNRRLHEVFPHLRRSPDPEEPWSSREITVDRKTTGDPTLQARGPGAKDILGARLDLVVIDDLLHNDNTRTKEARDKLHAWLDDVVMTRIVDIVHGEEPSPDDVFGRVFFIGNPWNADDLLARLSKLPGWDSLETSAVENPDDAPEHWRPTWPAQWPLRRLMERQKATLSHSFARKYLCRILSDDIRRFKKAWIDHAFAQGYGRELLEEQPTSRGVPLRCFSGVDYGIGKKQGDGKTVVADVALTPNERRAVVGLESGRWTGPKILKKLDKHQKIFDSEICTESNAAQEWMGQFADEEKGLPVVQLHTGKNKWDEEYGIESIAVELKAGLWIFPTGPAGFEPCGGTSTQWDTAYQELAELAQEMYDYDPESHTGDRLMALWKGREGARLWAQDRQQPTNQFRR